MKPHLKIKFAIGCQTNMYISKLKIQNIIKYSG